MTNETGIYAYSRLQAFREYAAYISGSEQALFVVVADSSCSAEVRESIEKAAHARGYSCGVTWVLPWAEAPHLDEAQLLESVEALDPLWTVVVGKDAVELVAQAYRLEPTEGAALALGRPACLLPHANELVATDKAKQALWAHIKSLPAKH